VAGASTAHDVFLTGGTGYIGRRLAPTLLKRGHRVRALVRSGSERKLAPGCEAVLGDAVDRSTYVGRIAPADTFVHLVGVAHPNPSKAALFRSVDLASARESIAASEQARISHFVYVSVAQPAPVMKDYVAARSDGERALRESGLPATVLRPWYVLGPGHRWPFLLWPMYAIARWIPSTRDTAQRLEPVTLGQMLAALVSAVENPPDCGVRIVEVPEIKRARFV
jgi:uncharacterized protein YbjT (DUF2867 family)